MLRAEKIVVMVWGEVVGMAGGGLIFETKRGGEKQV